MHEGNSVLLVDIDRQTTSYDWSLIRQEAGKHSPIEVARIMQPTLEANVPAYSDQYDQVVIDGAAKFDRMDVSALRVSDVVLVPVRPSYLDLWGAHDLLKHIKDEQARRRKLKAVFLVVGQVARTRIAADIGTALASLGLPVLESRTGNRVHYVQAASNGEGVIETAPRSKAAEEIRNLTTEILAL